jgi:hypothetical protein
MYTISPDFIFTTQNYHPGMITEQDLSSGHTIAYLEDFFYVTSSRNICIREHL